MSNCLNSLERDADALNVEFYNANAKTFDEVPFPDDLPNLFLKYVPKPCTILEIGSGPGAFAFWMQENGHQVTCIEPADVPAAQARKKNLNVLQMRFQDYKHDDLDEKFGCIAAISSLIHIPFVELPSQIKRIHDLLIPEGIAIFSFIEGEGERYEDPTEKGKNRFFSKIGMEQINELILPYFSLKESRRIKVEVMKQFFILVVLQKK